MGAEIEVKNSMNIPGRGGVLLGQVRAGTVRIGQMTPPLTLGDTPARRLEVISVERLSSIGAHGPAVGIGFRNPPHADDLKRALPAGSILKLENPGKTGTQAA